MNGLVAYKDLLKTVIYLIWNKKEHTSYHTLNLACPASRSSPFHKRAERKLWVLGSKPNQTHVLIYPSCLHPSFCSFVLMFLCLKICTPILMFLRPLVLKNYYASSVGRELPYNKKNDWSSMSCQSFLVPLSVLFSNQFIKDLDKIWELREWIPDPTKPILPPSKRIKHTA